MRKKKTTKHASAAAAMPLGLAMMLAHPGFAAPAKKKATKRKPKKRC